MTAIAIILGTLALAETLVHHYPSQPTARCLTLGFEKEEN